MSAPMSSYGSVLPPAAASGAGPAGAAAVPSSSGATTGPPASSAGSAAPGAPGFLPGLRDSAPARVPRDVSMSDLENARTVVADLVAASSVVFPGLEWAVAVARGSMGVPDLWVCNNEGACFIPAGVYLSRNMPVAAHLDTDFDDRWYGWFNPAERVVRAVRAMGYAVSAVATNWLTASDFVDEATPDVALGVAPSSSAQEALAGSLTRDRSHRLETLNSGLYRELAADEDAAEAYARYLIQHAVFGGPELSSTAQAVGRLVVGRQWPPEAQWDALQAEYTTDNLMTGSQRPGLLGVEDPHQLVTYREQFQRCRRVETLLCWREESPADVAYAAAMAGIATPSLMSVVAASSR
ncbi:putative methyl-accepting chemotaxis sensory transducer [uncultured Mycobacterium sp.]|uniref:Putative methyl-accepting chemotaxis sensory transducer n=1 Tax=uncultured Mycobacterium sp. TaxID=171292 RepID=A0A1Y5PLJ1_9MYCO|nr:putative methyl-accepting chemotaxis sensory transducer [uncultured Mycobacterium sp.]